MFGFEPRIYVTHQWAIVAHICLAIFGLALALPTPIGAPLAVVAIFGYAQFMYAAATNVYPWQEPFLVRWYGEALRRWTHFSEPLMVGFHAGQPVYVRSWQHDFCEYYDRNGYPIGCEQEFNWSATDMDWKPGDPEDIIIEFRHHDSNGRPKRMSWLSRLRSPELPESLPEKERSHPICSLLNMRLEGYVTNLSMRTAA